MTATGGEWPALPALLPGIRELIDGADVIGCLAHMDADADSLGSALAFAICLRATGKTVHVMVPSPRPLLLEYLPEFESAKVGDRDVDVLFTFDCPTPGRFGDLQHLLGKVKDVVNVDHHITNHGFGTINLVDTSASATGQVVHRLLTELGYEISAAAATNLYAALFTDTGGFRQENTSEAALRLGAELVARGTDAGWVALKSYKSRSVAQVKLEGLAVGKLQTAHDGRLIHTEVSTTMLRQSGADSQEAEGVIDHLTDIGSMKMAIVFREIAPERTKISVRTRDEFDATELCLRFGGGGHRRAAGAEIAMRLDDARQSVLAVASEIIDGSQARTA
jgi:bifunctional oligoribonuclease and PAP phosphatase NrnA